MILSILMSSCFASSSVTALPPYYQRTREISAILSNQKVYELIVSQNRELATGVIDGIVNKGFLSSGKGYMYEVYSGKCKLNVAASYVDSPGEIGPQKFEIVPSDVVNCQL